MAADEVSREATWAKAAGWDAVGLDFWRRGRATAKPSLACIEWLCEDLQPGDRCLIVGGTTIQLIRRAVTVGLSVTVLDFSSRICREVEALVANTVDVVHGNVLDPPALDRVDRLVCDTLLNRFDGAEATRFTRSAAELLRDGGQVRMTVKLGRYPMDERLLWLGRAAGTLNEFWDAGSNTVDFSKAGPLLEEALVAHGTLTRDELLTWYRARGREKRYERADLITLFNRPHWQLEMAMDQDRPDCCLVEAILQDHVHEWRPSEV